MRNADGGSFENSRTADGGILELDRADPLAARLDHILGAVGEAERIVRVDDGDVAGVEPVFGVDAVLVLLEVAPDDRATARLEVARAFAVAGQDLSTVVDD